MGVRAELSDVIFERGVIVAFAAPERDPFLPSGACSTSVFHAPHSGHFPYQEGVVFPQELHTYRAMGEVYQIGFSNSPCKL